MSASPAHALFYCSFCGRNQDEAGTVILSPSANICDVCVDSCNIILRERAQRREEEWLRLKDFAP